MPTEQVHEPDLMDLLNLYKKDIFNSLNCHAIATIQSYDKVTKTCKATINYKKTISKRNQLTGIYEDVLQDYPILINCPVVNLTGGKAGIRLPIAKSDVALIFFNDKDIDNWFIGKQTNGATATKRMHHFSDGIALVGVFSKNDASTDYNKNSVYIDQGRVIVYNGTTKISISENGKVKIENATDSLLPLLQQMITDLTTLTTTAISTAPGNAVITNPALVTNINLYLIKLQGLLE